MKDLLRWPRSLIVHAVEHLEEKTADSVKVALMLVDAAVEQMTKVHAMVSGHPRRDAREGFKHILAYLDGSGDVRRMVDLRGIQFYHQLKNQLYHMAPTEGPDALHVRRYAALAVALLAALARGALPDLEEIVIPGLTDEPRVAAATEGAAGAADRGRWSREEVSEFYNSSNHLGKAVLLALARKPEGLSQSELAADVRRILAGLDPDWPYEGLCGAVLLGVLVGFARRADGRRKAPLLTCAGGRCRVRQEVAGDVAAVADEERGRRAPPPLPLEDFGADT